MLPTIRLYDPFRLETDKINGIRFYDHLTSEFVACQAPCTKISPQTAFSVCTFSAKLTGILFELF
jgi:hypothetical protein